MLQTKNIDIDLLIQENYLFKEPEYSVLKITYDGRSSLQNRDNISLPFKSPSSKGKTKSDFSEYEKPNQKPGYIIHKKSEKILAEKPSENDDEANLIIENFNA